MDLNQFDTREKAAAGVPFPLIIDGETVYGDDDKPVTFNIKGVAAPDVHAFILKSRNADNDTPEKVYAADMKLARLAITGWSDNFTTNGEKVKYSKENVAVVLDNPVVREAVLRNVIEQRRFMNGS